MHKNLASGISSEPCLELPYQNQTRKAPLTVGIGPYASDLRTNTLSPSRRLPDFAITFQKNIQIKLKEVLATRSKSKKEDLRTMNMKQQGGEGTHEFIKLVAKSKGKRRVVAFLLPSPGASDGQEPPVANHWP